MAVTLSKALEKSRLNRSNSTNRVRVLSSYWGCDHRHKFSTYLTLVLEERDRLISIRRPGMNMKVQFSRRSNTNTEQSHNVQYERREHGTTI